MKLNSVLAALALSLVVGGAHAQAPETDAGGDVAAAATAAPATRPAEAASQAPDAAARAAEATAEKAEAEMGDEARPWTARVDALQAAVEARERQLVEETRLADENAARLVVEDAHTRKMLFLAAVTSSLMGPWMWVFIPTMLVLIGLLVMRPQVLTQYFRGDVIHEAYRVQRWVVPDVNPVLRNGLLVLAVLLTLGFAFAARAQTPASTGKTELPESAQLSLTLAERFLTTEGAERLVARLELLKQVQKGAATIDRTDELPANFPRISAVGALSAEHLAILALLYSHLNRTQDAVALDPMLALMLQPTPWGKVPEVLEPTAVALAEAKQLTSMPGLYARFRDHAKDVFTIVDVAQKVEATNAQWAAELVDAAERRAIAPEDQLIVLGYRRSKGETPELLAKISLLQARLSMLMAPRPLASVYAAAVRYKFPEIAAPVILKLEAMTLGTADALYLLERADSVGETERVAPIVVKACSQERANYLLFRAYDQGVRRKVPTLATAALERLRQAGLNGFDAAVDAMAGLQERDLKSDAQLLFDTALLLVRYEAQVAQLVQFARKHFDDARIEAALIRQADFMSRAELREALEQALSEDRFTLSIGLADRLALQATMESIVPPEKLTLASGRAFYEAPIKVSTLANFLRQTTGQPDYLSRQWGNAMPIIAWIILTDDEKLAEHIAVLLSNELTSFGILLEAAGHPTLGALVRGPLNDIILKRHELKLPIPLSLKPRWDTLQTQRSTLEMKLAEAKARATRLAGELATTVKRGDELRQQVIKGLPVAIATLVLFLLALWTATTRSILAARRADDFPIARFALTYVESVGWQLVTTLTLLPVGLLVVALSQWGLVPLAIHHTLRGPREPESLGAEETPPSAP